MEQQEHQRRMKLSISNIAWIGEQDETVYDWMQDLGFSGLEIAPTRIFPERPYEHLKDAAGWAKKLKEECGFTVPSMQSIWFGRTESLFGTEEERTALLDYTRKAIDFAEAVGCHNLVFGCPRNRNMPEMSEEYAASCMDLAITFFRELGEYAREHGTVIGMEANPPMYHTNFINTTKEALELVERVGSRGFLLNLDVGTMLANGEDCAELEGRTGLVNHVHISEPGLKPIQKRSLHQELKKLLQEERYGGFVSVEMGKTEDGSPDAAKDAMSYVRSIFS